MVDSVAVLPWALAILDSNGDPVSSGSIEFYNAGGLLARTVYSDHSLSTSLGDTVALNAGGVPINGSSTPVIIYTGTTDYKVIIKNSSGSTLYTFDNIDGALDTSSFITSNSGSFETPVTTTATDTTVTTSDIGNLFHVDPSVADRDFTLDSAADFGDGKRVGVRHNGTANNVRIASVNSEIIYMPNGSTTSGFVLTSRGHTVWLVSNGTDWIVDIVVPPLMTPDTPVIRIVDRLSTPPGSPTPGARYIVTSSPTGDWSSFSEHDVAEADGQGGWIQHTPATDCGWRAYVQDENENYQFQGSAWVEGEGYARAEEVTQTLVGTVTASSDAAVSFTDLDTTAFTYEIVLDNVKPSNDSVSFYMRTSTDNGSSYDSGASDYNWVYNNSSSGGSTTATGDETDSEIAIFDGNIGNAAGEEVSGIIRLFNPGDSSNQTRVVWEIYCQNTASTSTHVSGGGQRATAADVDAFQLFFSAGNVDSGVIKLYRVRAT